ncbi:MAG: deacylase [Candidatus Brocadia carolinensis]|uniref:Deacylase n=1 Tax=Candidatus Brocadia carolinensis TaxID=1004156 RepID=A0A1V4APM3_9BACT|nr:MAG: deacylase [Candidatus Brocadia caroliniensis]
MPAKKLKDFLDSHNIRYITISHSRAFTAEETAVSAHIPRKELAKTVMVKIDRKMAMAILPASDKLDLDLLKKETGAKQVEIAGEKEFKGLFPDCEVGAMPPFGNLYGMDVFVAKSLTEDREIAFNAGSRRELVRLAYKDFEQLVQPRVVKISVEIK